MVGRTMPTQPRGQYLTDALLRSLDPPQTGRKRTFDGDHGLYYEMSATSSRGRGRWGQRITFKGKRQTIGHGSYPQRSLTKARKEAEAVAALVADGIDPVAYKHRPPPPSFAEAAKKVWETNFVDSKKNSQYIQQWISSLEQHVFPVLGHRCVSEITRLDVLSVLLPLWVDKNRMAQNLRQRISLSMRWAMAYGYRTDDPADDTISVALPPSREAVHHPAIPHSEVSAVLDLVNKSGSQAAVKLLMQFLILTATRTSEARLARWEEVDSEGTIWTVPKDRMKRRRLHEVPLSTAAKAVLAAARKLQGGQSEFIFPMKNGCPPSDGACSRLLRTLRVEGVPHGFRSSFRNWCLDIGVDRELAEVCLAHAAPTPTEGAYARSTAVERRHDVMERWGQYLGGATGPGISCAPKSF